MNVQTAEGSITGVCFKLSQRPVRKENVPNSNCKSKDTHKGSSREDQGIWQWIYFGNENDFHILSRLIKKEILKKTKQKKIYIYI